MRFAGQGLAGLTGVGLSDFGGMSGTTMEYRGRERIAGHQAEAQTHGYGLKAISDIKSAEALAEATVAQGQAAGQAAMVGGIADGISGIAGGFAQRGGGGLPKVGTPARAKADMATLNNMDQTQWNGLFSGWSEGLNFPT